MTKADIVLRVHEKTGVNKAEASKYVESMLSLIKDTLESGQDVKIAGFGKFCVKEKQPRRGRNPQTGDAITISGRRILTFKPSHILRNSMNA